MPGRKQLTVTLDDPKLVSKLKAIGTSSNTVLEEPLVFSVNGMHWYLRKITSFVYDAEPVEAKLRGFGSFEENDSSKDLRVDMELFLRAHKSKGFIYLPS